MNSSTVHRKQIHRLVPTQNIFRACMNQGWCWTGQHSTYYIPGWYECVNFTGFLFQGTYKPGRLKFVCPHYQLMQGWKYLHPQTLNKWSKFLGPEIQLASITGVMGAKLAILDLGCQARTSPSIFSCVPCAARELLAYLWWPSPPWPSCWSVCGGCRLPWRAAPSGRDRYTSAGWSARCWRNPEKRRYSGLLFDRYLCSP